MQFGGEHCIDIIMLSAHKFGKVLDVRTWVLV